MRKLILFSAIIFGMLFYSCSSDDDNGTQDGTISLVGDWQLTHVDFTTLIDEGVLIPASDACILEIVSGYRFFDDNSFFFILGEAGSSFPTQGDYWTWEGDSDRFKIVQANPSMPPYNFGVTPTNLKVEEANGKTTMTFSSKLGNGSEANFTLVKQTIDNTKLPVVTDNGASYYCGFFDN